MEVTIDLERYAELVKAEYVAIALLHDIEERTNEYEGYSHAEVRMLRDLFAPNCGKVEQE